MPIIVQKDYAFLDDKEVQLALQRYVKATYNRDVDGRFTIETITDRDYKQSYKAKADLDPPVSS